VKPYYEASGITIFHGDCREILPTITADVIVTDPPYGIADIWQGGFGSGWGKAREKASLRNSWDGKPADVGCILELGLPSIIWGGNYFNLPASRGWLVWRKEVNPTLTLGDAELAWTNLDQVIRVFDHPRSKVTGKLVPEHPTTKPLPLMLWCLGFLQSGVVLDPFMGSGTTLVAAKNLGRRAIGIEIEERYCEIAARRLSQEVLNFGGAA
jgi:site-specific DNA-methyltransferase (adenine-specific)